MEKKLLAQHPFRIKILIAFFTFFTMNLAYSNFAAPTLMTIPAGGSVSLVTSASGTYYFVIPSNFICTWDTTPYVFLKNISYTIYQNPNNVAGAIFLMQGTGGVTVTKVCLNQTNQTYSVYYTTPTAGSKPIMAVYNATPSPSLITDAFGDNTPTFLTADYEIYCLIGVTAPPGQAAQYTGNC